MAAHLTAGLRLADFSLDNLTEAMRAICGNVLASAIPKLTADDLDELDRDIARAEELTGEEHRTERVDELTEFYRKVAQAPTIRSSSFLWMPCSTPAASSSHAAHRRPRLRHRGPQTPEKDLRLGDGDAARRERDEHLTDLHARWLRDNDLEVIVTTGLFTKEE
ncbi:hypothetical protein R1X32_21825 [Rhodococcus opacus]|nr:hypothetical protein [Rhodococcus sp. IEGM 1351]MDI9935269.1 hypothetical protein [Rhodococcus sp. IEGM 1351]WKN57517.1 hypothetical protein HJ581_0029250 [Rhodococcus opacus]